MGEAGEAGKGIAVKTSKGWTKSMALEWKGEEVIKITDQKISDAQSVNNLTDLTIGFLRYEALKKFSPHQYSNFWRKAMGSDKSFDSLVDELIEKEEAWRASNPGPK